MDRNPTRQITQSEQGCGLPSGSFKSRGVGNYLLAKLKDADDPRRVHFYCASGGNAGLACAHGAVTLSCKATIVVPLSTTPLMVRKLAEAGATDVVQVGASWQEANDHLTQVLMSDARSKGEEAIYVHPFDDADVWDGNAGIVREIARQLPQVANHYPQNVVPTLASSNDGQADGPARPDAIVCSVGGGGLFAGVMQGIDELGWHQTRVIAVETDGADSLAQAVQAGHPITLPAITSLATSLGARKVCQKAFEYGCRKDAVVSAVLSDSDGMRACKRFLDEERFLVELACSVCPAICYEEKLKDLVPGLNESSRVVLVICGGGNISFDVLDKYMKDTAFAAPS
ncbi:serine family amino acid catabolism- protein [Moelleriella libera RCEF 2490]|uniref:L-serine ammonia-lyase n=1 Tax=Moelleriella libera RCEF 2490 TaxID=1081109 RepID=A0A162MBG3_9HYPO|nr:serine family amino acid catabolism- protein [Moelleriella libera RCEF 2490]